MITGSCLCQSITWQYDGQFERMTHCHCGLCRKAHGSPFATYAVGPSEPFSYVSGEEHAVQFESPGFIRSFCKLCGSVLPNNHLGDIVAVPAGGLDDPLGIKPSAHIFAKWKAPWYEISDDLTQHDNYPEQPEPAVDRSAPPPSTDGKIRGSCMCGDVAYEIENGFDLALYCHCSRCRKGRSAAHASNGVVGPENFHFTKGEDKTVNYHHHGAEHFEQRFCQRCGSLMPGIVESLQLAFVPLGSLDDDLSQPIDSHIYVGSKCDWYPITDELPRYEGDPPQFG